MPTISKVMIYARGVPVGNRGWQKSFSTVWQAKLMDRPVVPRVNIIEFRNKVDVVSQTSPENLAARLFQLLKVAQKPVRRLTIEEPILGGDRSTIFSFYDKFLDISGEDQLRSILNDPNINNNLEALGLPLAAALGIKIVDFKKDGPRLGGFIDQSFRDHAATRLSSQVSEAVRSGPVAVAPTDFHPVVKSRGSREDTSSTIPLSSSVKGVSLYSYRQPLAYALVEALIFLIQTPIDREIKKNKRTILEQLSVIPAHLVATPPKLPDGEPLDSEAEHGPRRASWTLMVNTSDVSINLFGSDRPPVGLIGNFKFSGRLTIFRKPKKPSKEGIAHAHPFTNNVLQTFSVIGANWEEITLDFSPK